MLSAAREKKSYHHPDLKQSLIDAALALLREEGIKGFSLRKLAQRAGVSHAAPYRHFASKDALLSALILEGHRRLASALNAARRAETGDAAARLVALSRAYLAFARDNPEHLSIMFSSAGMGAAASCADLPPGADPCGYDSFGPLEATVRECQAEGALDPALAADALAMAVWSQIHGLSLLYNEGVIDAMSRMRGGDQERTIEAIFGILAARYGKVTAALPALPPFSGPEES